MRIIWVFISIVAAFLAGYKGYADPDRLFLMVDLMATIVSILISVSLALMAFLSTPFTISDSISNDGEERSRVKRLINGDDEDFFNAQLLLFAAFFVALAFLLLLKWSLCMTPHAFGDQTNRVVSAVASFFAVFSFFWSVTLPSRLRDLAKQRRNLS